MPKLKAKNLYWTWFLAKFLDVTAGIATIAAVKIRTIDNTIKLTVQLGNLLKVNVILFQTDELRRTKFS